MCRLTYQAKFIKKKKDQTKIELYILHDFAISVHFNSNDNVKKLDKTDN